MALFSFIQSLNTTFGTSIYEPVAVALAKTKFKNAISQASAGSKISKEAHDVIQQILDGLTTADKSPDKIEEVRQIKKVCQTGELRKVKPTKVDIMLQSYSEEIFLFDLKTVKPNKGNFKELKRTLLEWVAAMLCQNPDLKVNSLIAIPYNPYEPKPYDRWTMRGMLDLEHELKVAEEFWDFLGGEGAYEDLLNCFERVGIELRPEIDEYFSRFKR
ncbi:MAG: TdeIII family type II restriction endonuclease [Saprospiraceae bacterium]